MKKTLPQVSAIIVKYRSEQYLKNCLDSLNKQKEVSLEIIVVDNDKNNVGYGAGCNKGAKEAKGKYLLFLNPDTVFLGDNLKKAIAYLEKHPKVGVLGPKIYQNFSKVPQISCCRFPNPLFSFFIFSPIKSIWPNNPIFTYLVYGQNKKKINGVLSVDAVAGAAMIIRKEVFNKIGGFDSNFFLYFEENDLCQRIKKEGFEIVFFPYTKIVHFGGKSTTNFEKSFSSEITKNPSKTCGIIMKPPRPWKGGVSSSRGKVPASRERLRFLLHSSPPLERRGILKREIKSKLLEAKPNVGQNVKIINPSIFYFRQSREYFFKKHYGKTLGGLIEKIHKFLEFLANR